MNREQRVALGLGLFAILYMAGAWRLPRFALATGVIDAHVFPLVLGSVLLLLSLIYFVQSRKLTETTPLMAGVDRPLLLKLMGATIVYALVLGLLGFVVATSLFLIGVMAVLGYRQWRKTVTIGLGFSLIVYTVFAYVLEVPLAQGILPF